MPRLLFALLLLAASAAAQAAPPTLQSGSQLIYRGSIDEDRGEAGMMTRKTFELTLLIARRGEQRATLYWHVKQNGRGDWPWSGRFGRADVGADWRAGSMGPALLYDRDEGKAVVPLRMPMLDVPKSAAKGVRWKSGALEFEIRGIEKVGDRDTWRVFVHSRRGHLQTLWVERGSPLIVKMAQTVIMGRGVPYAMEMKLADRQRLDQKSVASTVAGYDALIGLRDKLKIPARSVQARFDDKQLKTLKSELPEAQRRAAGIKLLEPLAAAAATDLKQQSLRVTSVADLTKQQEGKPAAMFRLSGTSGEKLSEENLRGSITVLHFWGYRDKPLKQPYGQVGYLDFLRQKRKAAGVKVYGVAVSSDLDLPISRDRVIRSVKKLKSFMNLGYPVLLDTGDVLKKFGDPRPLGAHLPLFVVIGPDGKIAHYHVGHYKVHPDRGLEELDKVVGKLLEGK
jgi:peroxiredoxin